MSERTGTILAVVPHGGLMTILVTEGGTVESLIGDSGPTGRALIDMFGRGILAGPLMLDTAKLKGQRISYDTDDMGLLSYIRDPEEEP